MTLLFRLSFSLLTIFPALCLANSSETDLQTKSIFILNRLAFGPKPGEAEKLAASGEAGIDQWIEEQLHPERIDDSIVNKKLAKIHPQKTSYEMIEKSFGSIREYARENKIDIGKIASTEPSTSPAFTRLHLD